jgi:hypothetical protein
MRALTVSIEHAQVSTNCGSLSAPSIAELELLLRNEFALA